ncbi:MAG: sigma-70 family RNA polymerase sigma factor [Kofleriaceae bacterium]
MPVLVDRFMERLRVHHEVVPGAELTAALEELTAAVVAAWPMQPVPLADFMDWVADRLSAQPDIAAAVGAIRGADLYLACACARGDAAAVAAFETAYMPGIRAALRSMRAADATLDEVLQQIRERLLVGDTTRGPRIADYVGRGDLRRWVRASAVHTYLNLRRGLKREVLVEDDRVFDAVSTPDVDPELAHMKRLYRDEFKEAFHEAVATLTDQEKNVLRFCHVDRLNIDEVARVYRVHRSTMNRWLASARSNLATATEQALRRRLGVQHSELASIRRLVESQIDLSLVRVLGSDPKTS